MTQLLAFAVIWPVVVTLLCLLVIWGVTWLRADRAASHTTHVQEVPPWPARK